METIVVYYSLTGYTRAVAERTAAECKADLAEILEIRHRSVFGAFVFGAFQAMRSRPSRIVPMTQDFSSYGRIIIVSPVWSASPVPAVYAFIHDHLPSGKEVEVILNSGGGESGDACGKLRKAIEKKGSRLSSCQDVKAPPRTVKK